MLAEDLVHFAATHAIGFVQNSDNMHCTSSQPRNFRRCNFLQPVTRGLNTANILQYTRIAKELGAPFIRMEIDDERYHPRTESVIDIIRALLPLLRQEVVVLAIENHDRFGHACSKRSSGKQMIGG